jgi:CHAD domain-containing protein
MELMSQILLTDEQMQQLGLLTRSAPDAISRRARLILGYAEGKPTLQAAMQAGISRGRARFWKRQFLSKGMDIFNIQESGYSADNKPASKVDIPGGELTVEVSQIEKSESQAEGQKDFPYPQPQKSIGISPEDTLAEAGRKVWLFHFAEMLSHEEGTLLGENIEELHDMRVATRRMRSAFDVFGSAYEPKVIKHYLKGLRAIGRVLGQVRDMDVIVEHAVNYQEKLENKEHTGLNPLLGAWKQSIETDRSKLKLHLQSESYHHFKHEFNCFLQSPEINHESISKQAGTTARVRDIVPVLVYSRFAAVRAYEMLLPTASVAQLHALRIEFKKFRYSLEYFREILGTGVDKAISELKLLQDHLGELHDADVACQLVRSFLKSWEEDQLYQPIPERLNPEPIVTYLAFLHAERYRLLITFPAAWVNFNRPEFRQYLARAVSAL